MTREEAIAFGKRVIDLGLNDETAEFCEMAISALSEIKGEPTYYPPCIDCNKKMDEIRRTYDKLKELPSVENKGEWIKDSLDMVVCSNCGEWRRDNRIKHINFCNCCGADMRGE